MKKLSFFLAWHYFRGLKNNKNIATMLKLCFTSIFISSFALALVMAIMNGFEKATYEKMQGIHANIIIRSFGNELDAPLIDAVLKKEFPEIAASSPTTTRQAIFQAAGSDDITTVIMLKAIDPLLESRTTQIERKIIQRKKNSASLSDLLGDDQLVIGATLAKNLGVGINDTVNILFSKDTQSRSRSISFEEKKATVSGIFSTGIDEFDSSMALSSFDFFNQLFPDAGVSQINLTLDAKANEEHVIANLKKRLNLDVYSWKDLYTPLVSALKLEKYAMFLVLALLTLVASMNIISLLFMHITQKRGDIAILQSMGVDTSSISAIFLIMGMTISFIACVCGLLCACITSWTLETYPFVTLPDAYYVSHLPARMELHLLLLVFFAVMIISFISTWFPAQKTKNINISDVLRFEA